MIGMLIGAAIAFVVENADEIADVFVDVVGDVWEVIAGNAGEWVVDGSIDLISSNPDKAIEIICDVGEAVTDKVRKVL